MPYAGNAKIQIVPDQTTNTAGAAEVAADATESGTLEGATATLRYGAAIISEARYGSLSGVVLNWIKSAFQNQT